MQTSLITFENTLNMVKQLSVTDQLRLLEWIATQVKQIVSQAFTPALPDQQTGFLAEVAAFEQLKAELLQKYQGQFVAIYQGQVVEVGHDELEVLRQVDKRFGEVPCYIELVAENSPRRARVTSAWTVHS